MYFMIAPLGRADALHPCFTRDVEAVGSSRTSAWTAGDYTLDLRDEPATGEVGADGSERWRS
jgi:hypothetical protein